MSQIYRYFNVYHKSQNHEKKLNMFKKPRENPMLQQILDTLYIKREHNLFLLNGVFPDF